MTAHRAQALAPAIMLLAALVAPPSAADTAQDCATLKKMSAEYSKLADRLAHLRKTADEQQDDIAALTVTQRKIVDVARTIGDKLQKMQIHLDDPILAYAFQKDAVSFQEYADSLEGAVNNGDIAGTSIHVTRSYSRNVDATEAANNAYHERCK